MKPFVVLAVVFLCICNAQAATRRLAADCRVASTFTPSATTPFDLDWCTIADWDDVRSLSLDIANRWPGRVYLRAPSRTRRVQTDTTNWSTDPVVPVKTFVLLEDQDAANKLIVTHRLAATNKFVMWAFANFQTVKIGGPRLTITFKGTHPGLGNGNPDTNSGLLDFRVNDDSTPDLLDVRANVRDAQNYGFFVGGAVQGTVLGGTADRIRQLNLAGKFWNAPVVVQGNVQNLWYDPANLVISDPYNRTMGWDGVVATTAEGRDIGCFDKARRQIRTAGGSFFYVDKATGGLTLEYGTLNFIPRSVGAIGNSAADPFVVKIKDWGASGPENLTGYPSGVAVKAGIDAVLFKGDPHPELGHTQPFRFIRFEMLPPDFGNGVHAYEIGAGCSPDNLTNNDAHSGYANLIRLEANRGGLPYQNVNSLWHVELLGNFTNRFLKRGPLLLTAFQPEDSPGPTVADRSYGHVVSVAAGTTITDTVNLLDTDTATGPGTWRNLTSKVVTTTSGRIIRPRSNAIRDTHVAGLVDIGPYATNMVIDNVDFRPGGLRTIVRVNSSSSVTISRICAEPGSRIVGTGTVTLNGKPITLPRTISIGMGCVL